MKKYRSEKFVFCDLSDEIINGEERFGKYTYALARARRMWAICLARYGDAPSF